MQISLFQRLKRRLRRMETGQSVIILAFAFLALIAFVGITTDISLMFVRFAQLRRAVDSASIAAANQLRQDREVASVRLAANQFIEFYGLNPEDVEVLTCDWIPADDKPNYPELCPVEQSKIVRVTAQVSSPTVFLRLLGINEFPLTAEAYSQTASLDVVLIMDVSGSMLRETTYEDWARIESYGANAEDITNVNLGVVYLPPRVGFDNSETGSIFATKVASGDFGIVGTPLENVDTTFSRFANEPSGLNYDRGYWRAYLMANHQSVINRQLVYTPTTPPTGCTNYTTDSECYPEVGDAIPTGDAALGVTVANDCDPISDTNCDDAFRVRYIDNFFNDPTNAAPIIGDSEHPREACRVRFSPAARFYGAGSSYLYRNPTTGALVPLSDFYASISYTTPFDGFAPSYNFFGCCNDPNGDGFFEDLACQPFKQARDAAFDFFQRIDFTRGDRAAIVTFARSAFIINPYAEVEVASGDPLVGTGEFQRLPAIMDDGQIAFEAMRDLVGVRAEPNFYQWNIDRIDAAELQADIDADVATRFNTSGWVRPNQVDVDEGISVYAAGIGEDGESLPLYYEIDPGITEGASRVNYPLRGDCAFTNAGLAEYANAYYGGLQRIMQPHRYPFSFNPGISPNITYTDPVYGGTNTVQLWDTAQPTNWDRYALTLSYEQSAACRDTNMGAALREGNNALLEDSRSEGRVWIMVLLSDGAAGASDPVRRAGGEKISPADPFFEEIDPLSGNPTGNFGVPGDYGSFGLCPIGSMYNESGTPLTIANARPGELLAVGEEGNPGNYFEGNDVAGDGYVLYNNRLPICLDENPRSRHFCDGFRPRLTALAAAGAEGATIPPNGPQAFLWDLDFVRYKDENYRPAAFATQEDWVPQPFDLNDNGTIEPGEEALLYEVPAVYPALTPAGFTHPKAGDIHPRAGQIFAGPQLAAEDVVVEWNRANNNFLDVDLGEINDLGLPENEGCLQYDVDDYARDWADAIALEDLGSGGDRSLTQLPSIFTIGFGLNFTERTGPREDGAAIVTVTDTAYDDICRLNIEDCLGEQLLRYIADAGDNNRIDNDYWQNILDDRATPDEFYSDQFPDGTIDTPGESFGQRGPCQTDDVRADPDPDVGYRELDGVAGSDLSDAEEEDLWGALPPRTNCGNYFNAPNEDELQFVFDEIASRMFTRINR